jgi:hypothetical protein
MTFWTTQSNGTQGERMRITGTGVIGIGTSTLLDAGLTIETNSNSLNALALRDSRAFSTIPEVALAFRVKYNTAGAYATPALLVAYKDNATDGNQSGSLAFFTNANSGPVERMRLTSTGRLELKTEGFVSQKGASNTIGGGSFIGLQQTGAGSSERWMLQQLNSSYGLDYWSYNGTSWSTIGTIGADGSVVFQSSTSPIIRAKSNNQYVNAVVSASWDTGSAMEIAYNPNSAVGFIQNTYPITSGQVYGDINFRQNSAGTMVTRMTIKADGGQVLKPSNPAFRAYNSVNGFWYVNNNDTLIFDVTEYNIGNCYNTSNGRFTAPVAGVYQFNFYTIVYGNLQNGAISLRKNGGAPTSGHNIHFSPYYTSVSWSNVVYTTSLYLNAGDYIFLINSTGVQIPIHGDDWSSFSGYLVG